MAATEIKFKIEDEQVRVNNHTQYGMRYPDGTIKWDADRDGGGYYIVEFEDMALGGVSAVRAWGQLLESRAKAGNVDLHDYTAQHQLVKRSIIIAVAGTEEV